MHKTSPCIPVRRSEVERYRAETAAAANDDRTQQLRALSAELAAVEEQVGPGLCQLRGCGQQGSQHNAQHGLHVPS